LEESFWLVESKRRRTNTTIMLDTEIKKILKQHFYGKMSDIINLLLREWLEKQGYRIDSNGTRK